MSFVFSEVWNATFEGSPPDTENINLGAGRIRNLKVDIRQRMLIDHQWAGNEFDGKHKQVQLSPNVDPTLDAGDACVYAKLISGNTELFYKDSSGHVIQLTAGGGILISSSFPSLTRLAFSNAAPPPGWTQLTGIHDRVIRMVDDSSGQGIGGSWTLSGISVATSTTTSTGTTTGVGFTGSISVDNHTLTTAEIPALTFSSDYPTFAGTLNASGSNASSLATGTTTHSTNTIGGGGAHGHTLSNSLGANATSVSTSSSNSVSTPSSDASWRPAYLNFCLGQKT